MFLLFWQESNESDAFYVDKSRKKQAFEENSALANLAVLLDTYEILNTIEQSMDIYSKVRTSTDQ